MKLILLSGGSGKRLWPLSNEARSKQFLRVLKDENGNYESMVQRVWKQLKKIGIDQSTIIATSKYQKEVLQNQLKGVADLVVEPDRRDTFPAIALATAYLIKAYGVQEDEVVAVLPVDPYVETEFFDKVIDLESAIKNTKSNIALIGIKPTLPSSKYGYIVPERSFKNSSEILYVSHFFEKPSEDRARKLIDGGALWNSGVFAFKVSYLLNLLKDNGYPTEYDQMLKQYDLLPKISFDYEVVEKCSKIISLVYEKSWKDLGTWNTLTDEMKSNQIGKGFLSQNSVNTHLINELDIPVMVLGIKNAIVAVSPDGILVSDKDESTKIKNFVDKLDNRPMYEERRWGWYRVLDYTQNKNGENVVTKRIGIKTGRNLSYQYHLLRKEIWTIIRGSGIVALNGELQMVKSGDVIEINHKDKHAIRAIENLEIIEIQTGPELIDEDIIRLYTDWDEIEKICKQNQTT